MASAERADFLDSMVNWLYSPERMTLHGSGPQSGVAHCESTSGDAGLTVADVPRLRFAYADPPYIGQAAKHYGMPEVDHAELIERLNTYDGWALSLSSPSLKEILGLCPDDVRVMAWVKPFASFKPNVNPAYAWEPVIVRGGRRYERSDPTVRDWVSANIALKRGLPGAKPAEFCRWILAVLNVQPGDELDDLFPGTGIMSAVAAQGTLGN